MSYTLWSHGRLLGTSELNYSRVFPRHRMGDFYPTAIGAKLMPVATGVSPTSIGLARVVSGKGPGSPAALSEEEIRKTSEYADFIAAVTHQEALDLELHAPDGSVIPTEWINVRDTEFLLSLVDDEFIDELEADLAGNEWEENDIEWSQEDAEAEFDAWLERLDESWSSLDVEQSTGDDDGKEFPRYQLQVMLRDAAAVP